MSNNLSHCRKTGQSDESSPITGNWRKSSFSGSIGDCVEVSSHVIPLNRILVRDSKAPSGPYLSFTSDAWTDFLGTCFENIPHASA